MIRDSRGASLTLETKVSRVMYSWPATAIRPVIDAAMLRGSLISGYVYSVQCLGKGKIGMSLVAEGSMARLPCDGLWRRRTMWLRTNAHSLTNHAAARARRESANLLRWEAILALAELNCAGSGYARWKRDAASWDCWRRSKVERKKPGRKECSCCQGG